MGVGPMVQDRDAEEKRGEHPGQHLGESSQRGVRQCPGRWPCIREGLGECFQEIGMVSEVKSCYECDDVS